MRKTNEKRQQILDTAYHLFSSKGFDKTSMSEITAEVGGSKATIYNYFTSKEELFVECMFGISENYMDGISASLENPNTNVSDALKKLGTDVLHMLCSPELLAVRKLIIAEAGRSGIGRMFFEKISARKKELAAYLANFMKAGTLRKADPNFAADQFRALLEAEYFEPLILLALDTPPTDQALKKAAIRAVDTFLRAYAP